MRMRWLRGSGGDGLDISFEDGRRRRVAIQKIEINHKKLQSDTEL